MTELTKKQVTWRIFGFFIYALGMLYCLRIKEGAEIAITQHVAGFILSVVTAFFYLLIPFYEQKVEGWFTGETPERKKLTDRDTALYFIILTLAFAVQFFLIKTN